VGGLRNFFFPFPFSLATGRSEGCSPSNGHPDHCRSNLSRGGSDGQVSCKLTTSDLRVAALFRNPSWRRNFQFCWAVSRFVTRELTLLLMVDTALRGLAAPPLSAQPSPPKRDTTHTAEDRRGLPELDHSRKQLADDTTAHEARHLDPYDSVNRLPFQSKMFSYLAFPLGILLSTATTLGCFANCVCHGPVILSPAKSLLKPSIIRLGDFLRLEVWLEHVLAFCRSGSGRARHCRVCVGRTRQFSISRRFGGDEQAPHPNIQMMCSF
jgi:hypothetical protein